MCFVWISEQTAIISLYSTNCLVFVTETECVYCAVRAGSLYRTQVSHRLYSVCICMLCLRWTPESAAFLHTQNASVPRYCDWCWAITACEVRNDASSAMPLCRCISNILSAKFCHNLHWFRLFLSAWKNSTRKECEIHKTERKIHKNFSCWGKAYGDVGCRESRVKGKEGVRPWLILHATRIGQLWEIGSVCLTSTHSVCFLSLCVSFFSPLRNIALPESYPAPQTNHSYFPLVLPLKNRFPSSSTIHPFCRNLATKLLIGPACLVSW
jgi:hypothetical protein